MTKEEMKNNYQKIYAWMTILNLHDKFTNPDDKPNYPLIGKVWAARKNYIALEKVFYNLYKQGVHQKYKDDPDHIFKIVMIAIKPKRKAKKQEQENATAINM